VQKNLETASAKRTPSVGSVSFSPEDFPDPEGAFVVVLTEIRGCLFCGVEGEGNRRFMKRGLRVPAWPSLATRRHPPWSTHPRAIPKSVAPMKKPTDGSA
jgi:hypothetical protein